MQFYRTRVGRRGLYILKEAIRHPQWSWSQWKQTGWMDVDVEVVESAWLAESFKC